MADVEIARRLRRESSDNLALDGSLQTECKTGSGLVVACLGSLCSGKIGDQGLGGLEVVEVGEPSGKVDMQVVLEEAKHLDAACAMKLVRFVGQRESNAERTFQSTPDGPVRCRDVMSDEICAISQMIVERVQSSDDVIERGQSSQTRRESEEGGCLSRD